MNAETRRRFESAGVKVSQLEAIAGPDGLITGQPEAERLYALVDGLEKPGSPEHIDTRTSKNVPTASGKAYDALKAELDRNLAKATLGAAGCERPTMAKTPA